MFFVFFLKKKKTQYPLNLTKTVTKILMIVAFKIVMCLKKKKIRHVLHCKFYVSVSLTSGRKMYWHLNLKDE